MFAPLKKGAFFYQVIFMILSRCCKNIVYIVHDYYVCDKCHLCCATIDSSRIVKTKKENFDDTRITSKTSELISTE